MRQKAERYQDAAERTIKDIRRQTRKRYSSEEKIRIVLAGLRGEDSIAELCRQEGIAQGLYYSWSKEFFEAGKKRLAGGHGTSGHNRLPPAHVDGAKQGTRSLLVVASSRFMITIWPASFGQCPLLALSGHLFRER